MRDTIKKWWNRTWSNWEIVYENYSNFYIVLKKTSNDGLIKYKKIKTL
jgi:hypothetical protein